MLVQDIVELAKIKLQNLTVSKNDSALIKFTFLGVSELFRRFNLSIKAETILVNENLAMYELRNSDVSMLLGIYDVTGRELTQTDIYNSQNYDYKMVNFFINITLKSIICIGTVCYLFRDFIVKNLVLRMTVCLLLVNFTLKS